MSQIMKMIRILMTKQNLMLNKIMMNPMNNSLKLKKDFNNNKILIVHVNPA